MPKLVGWQVNSTRNVAFVPPVVSMHRARVSCYSLTGSVTGDKGDLRQACTC